MDNNSLAHIKWNCKYHIAFTPEYRRQILYKQISADIDQIIRTLCARKGIEIIEAVALPDHIHLYITIPPKYGVSEIVRNLKGKSSIYRPPMIDLHFRMLNPLYAAENPCTTAALPTHNSAGQHDQRRRSKCSTALGICIHDYIALQGVIQTIF